MKLKIISLNIWNKSPIRDKAIAFLKAEDADIVLLQEVYNGGAQAPAKYRTLHGLKTRLNYKYIEYIESFSEYSKDGVFPQGNAVLSKLPILSNRRQFMVEPISENFKYYDQPENWPLLPAPMQHVEIESQVGLLNVFNIHGVWDLEGDKYTERRQQMVRVILENIKGKDNVILAGDTNAKASNPGMLEIERHLKSVFDQELKSTFNMRRKINPGYATSPVDLMFVSKNIKVVSKAVPDIDVSDHLPLIVSLEV